MTTDADHLVACLSRGPATELRLTCEFVTKIGVYAEAELRCKNALVVALSDGRIEMFRTGCYRLSNSSAKMEDEKPQTKSPNDVWKDAIREHK